MCGGELLALSGPKFGMCIGVDFSSAQLGRASSSVAGLGNVNLVAASVESGLPFLDLYFDAVVCIASLEYIVNVEGLLEEIRRVTRPGGTLIFQVGNIASLRNRLRLLVGRLPKTTGLAVGYNGNMLHYLTLASLIGYVERFGFRYKMVRCSGRLFFIRDLFPSILGDDLIVVFQAR